VVIINGEEFDAMLIPRNAMVEIDFSQFPEDDPLRRQRNVEKLTEVDLDLKHDLSTEPSGERRMFRLTKRGAKRLLESL
jgi:hypothetical protein